MAKAYRIMGLLLILSLFPAMGVLAACAAQPEAATAQRQPVLAAAEKSLVTVYYATADGAALLPVTLEVNATTEAARVALEKLLAGPMADGLTDSIPTDTKLLDLYSIYHTVYVDLSEDFLDIPPDRAQQAIDALAATVLPLTECNCLQLLVEGEGVRALGPVDLSQPVGLPLINPWPQAPALDTSADVAPAAAPAEEAAPAELARLTFYLPDPAGSGFIIPYTAEFALEPTMPSTLAQASAILGVWQSQGLLGEGALLEADTQAGLISLSCAASCCADMGARQEQAFCQALTRSFCGLPEVGGLNLYLSGELVEELPQGTLLSQPLTCTGPVNRL